MDMPKRVKRWWRVYGSGNGYLILKYGNKVVASIPDGGAIAVGDRSKLTAVLHAVITATKAGELDTPSRSPRVKTRSPRARRLECK